MGRLLAAVLLAATGCGDDGAPVHPDGGEGDGGRPGLDAGPGFDGGSGADGGGADSGGGVDAGDLEVLSLSIGPITVARGVERTECIEVPLGNTEPVFVHELRTHIGRGSHHMLVYRSAATSPRPDPYPCAPFTDILVGGAPVALAQEPEGGVRYPDGTGLRLDPDQMIRIELHYINYFGEGPIDITSSVDFYVSRGAGDGLQEIDFIFAGTTDINVPAHSTGSAVRFYQPPASASEPLHLFAMSTHNHQYGELSYVERTASPDGAGTEIYRSTSWSEPPIDRYDPPLVFDGSDGLRVTCNYNNFSDSTVRFGEGFNDEMCFMIGYYYPSRGFLLAL